MSPSITNSTGDLYSDEDVDDYEIDDDLDKDIEALGQACMRPYLNTTATTAATTTATTNFNLPSPSSADGDFSGDDGGQQEDDFELLRNVQKRFDSSSLLDISPTIEDDNDFDTLCAVQRRFAAYDNNDTLRKGMQNSAENVASDLDTCDAHTFLALEVNDISRFPKPTQLLHDAIKRNRSCQKFLESKLGHIQARIEENKKLKERVDIIKGMQFFCRKTTGRDLALGKDPRIQLISVQRILSCETSKSKDNDKKVSAMHDGPLENSHVAYYRKVLANSPHMMKHKKWKEAENENLRKGIRQQFQELALQFSMEQISGPEGYSSVLNCLYVVTASIKDLEITPKMCREFLPKINCNQLASLYVIGRTGAECESQWLNSEDPLINHSKWPAKEEKKLLFILQEKGMINWFDIAVSLGTNRTPFQCLEHFQRSLNARILKSDWTGEEDAQLFIAVKTFGETDWQSVASSLVGRTGPQCSNSKSLMPTLFHNFHMGESTPPGKMDRGSKQCLRRRKELFPDKVPLLQAARRIKKAAIIRNFVDREVYRPAKIESLFQWVFLLFCMWFFECSNTSKRRGSKRRNVGAQISNEEAPGITNGTEAGYKYGKTKKGTKTRSRKNSLVQQAQDDLTLNFVSVPVTVTDDNDTGKNGESCKSQPRRAESILEEIDGNNQSCSMFHPESSELRMIDYDGIGTIDSNNLESSQKICSKSGDEEQFLITGFADIFMSSLDCPNSNLLEITNGHQDETVGQPDIQARSLH